MGYSYISGLLGFAISRPFRPAFKNTGTSHLIILNVTANAIPLNASEATKGAPSPWKVFRRMPTQAPTKAKSRQVSWRERELEFAAAIAQMVRYEPISKASC